MNRLFQIAYALLLSSGLGAQNMANGEYWIDNDPGFGMATAISFPNSNDVSSQMENVDLNGLSPGLHYMGLRTKDENGVWGLTTLRSFIVEADNIYPVSSTEYFTDVDQGFGNATDAALGSGMDINGAQASFDLSASNTGLEYICFRSKNSEGVWSLTQCRTLIVEHSDDNDVVSLEYFWDVDPGFGNGTVEQLGQGSDVPNYSLMADVALLPGEHYIYSRSIDERGAWSHTNMDTVQVVPVGIDELELLGISVFPNPFMDDLTISPDGPVDLMVDLRDMQGRSVLNRRITSRTTLEINDLAQGMYQMLIILPSGNIYSTKLTKQ